MNAKWKPISKNVIKFLISCGEKYIINCIFLFHWENGDRCNFKTLASGHVGEFGNEAV